MKNILEFIILSITIHLGKNPKNGGNPPKEKKFINKQNLKTNLLFKVKKIWFKWNKLNILNIIIIEILVIA